MSAKTPRRLGAPPAETKKAAPPPKAKPAKKGAVIDDASFFLAELRALSGKSKEEEPFGFLSSDDDLPPLDTPIDEFVSTGTLALDKQIGGVRGGWPIGRITEVAAWESVGKSTLLDQSLAQVQRMGGVGALIDSERARDSRYTATLGVDTTKLITKNVTTVEETFAAIDAILDVQEKIASLAARKGGKPPPLLIVWDSVGGTPTKAELEGDADDQHVASAAKAIKRNFRRIAHRIAHLRTALVCANHFYQDIGPFASLKTYGGSGMRYFTSLRLWLTRKSEVKIGTAVLGHIVEAKIRKTRIRASRTPQEVALLYGAGFDNSWTLYEWGKLHGLDDKHRWIVPAGSWDHLMLADGTHESFQRRFLGLGEVLARRPDVYQMLAEAYLREGEVLGDGEPEAKDDDDDEDAP